MFHIFLCVSHSWESLEPVCPVKIRRLGRACRCLVTRRERVSETVVETAKNWVKSARQQKAQMLKILPLIHNDNAILDIFKFIILFLFLFLFDNIFTSIGGFTNYDQTLSNTGFSDMFSLQWHEQKSRIMKKNGVLSKLKCIMGLNTFIGWYCLYPKNRETVRIDMSLWNCFPICLNLVVVI